MADRHVRFTVPPSGQPTITVDEVDISNRVSHITIDMAARDTRPDIEVTLAARSLDVFAGRANTGLLRGLSDLTAGFGTATVALAVWIMW